MMMFGFMWIIILLVIIVPIGLLLVWLFKPGTQGQFRDPHQPGATLPRADNPPTELNNPTGPEPLARQCAHCGASLQPEWTHCPNCGAPVG